MRTVRLLDIATLTVGSGSNRSLVVEIGVTATIVRGDPNHGAASATFNSTGTGITASGEGTDANAVLREVFNLLNRWLYLTVREDVLSFRPEKLLP